MNKKDLRIQGYSDKRIQGVMKVTCDLSDKKDLKRKENYV